MQSSEDLRRLLSRIDGRGYKAYRDIRGTYDFDGYTLFVDYVQGDPFASPSRIRVRIPLSRAGFPADTFSSPIRRDAAQKNPALQSPAQEMFFEELPRIVERSLLFSSLPREVLYRHIETCEDADVLRGELDAMGLVAFVADGSILPRASGIDPRPLSRGKVVPFLSPPSLRREVELPNRGRVTGMGIPKGVTHRARGIAEKFKAERKPEGGERFGDITPRIPLSGSFDPSKGRREVKISPKGLHSIAFGRHSINLACIEQLVDISQTRSIGESIHYATRYMDGKRTLREIIERISRDISQEGLNVLVTQPVGDLAAFRGLELAAAINRLRTLSVRQAHD